MPQLAQYYQQTSVSGGMQPDAPQPVPASGAEAAGLGNLGAGMESLASGMAHDQRANQLLLKRQADEDGKAWAGNAVPDLTVKLTGLYDDMKSKATGAATGFVPDYLSKFDDTAKATIAMAPTPDAKRYLTQHLQSLRTVLGTNAVQFEADSTRAWRVDQSDQGSDKWATIVAQHPEQYGTAMAAVEQTLPDVGPAMREKLLDSSRKKLLYAAAGTSVQADPHSTFDALSSALNLPVSDAPNPFKVADKVATMPGPLQRVIAAVYGQESNSGTVDTSQPNYAGARGPMQVTQATFEGLKASGAIPADYRFDNPDNTAEAGVTLLTSLYGKYNGDVRKVAAAYYAGEKAVNPDGTINDFKDLKNPKAPSTLQYADSVVARMGTGSQPEPLKPLEQVVLKGDQSKTGIGWIDAMRPDELLHYRQQAYTEMQRTSSVARTGIERMEKDIQAQAISGVVPTNIPSRDSYVAAFGPVNGVIRYKENVEDMVDLGRGIGLMQSAGPEDRAAIIQRATPAPGDGFAASAQKQARLIQANAIIEKQLKDDPASYVTRNSSRVKAAFDQLQSLGPDASPDDQRAAVDRYAAESLAEQTRLGAKRPQLLTDDQASKIALQFSSQKEGGDNSAKLVENLQKQWGSNFPVIFQQLQRDDKLPGDVMVIPNMKDAGSKERLARLALVPDKDLKERLAPGDSKDLDAALLSTMEPFWNTLAVQGGGERTYATVKHSTERLAMSYMAGGKSASEAVKQAYDETVGHAYSFEKTYRVPNAEIPDQVTQGVTGVTRHLEDLPLVIPPAAPGMRPDDAKKQYLDAVKSGAVFATNPDESGLLLYVKGATGMVPVKTPFGQVSFSWKQLRDEYQSMQGKPYIGIPKL